MYYKFVLYQCQSCVTILYIITVITEIKIIAILVNNAFNKELLANHIRTCVARDIRDGKDETIDELVATLQKLMK